ncbi:elongator complex protein 5 isoform X2 [Antennarius striatus]|uniref:elongator complex protein 5 isoform X2 n=1 Tax=Antennarius striatus TaxID=241820 RepID=UPI0035ADA601
MLTDLLQSTDGGVFLIIQDSASCCGRDLLKSFISYALHRDEAVHVLGFEVSEDEMKDGLKGSQIQRLRFHNAHTDPLGWNDEKTFTVQQFSLEALRHLVEQTSHPKPAALVIDSLSWILRHHSPSIVCRTLDQLRKGGTVRAVIGLLHADMHQRGTVGSVCHLATSVITVAPGMKGDEAVAKMTKRSKSGKVVQDVSSDSLSIILFFSAVKKVYFLYPQEEIFSIRDDLTVITQSRPSPPGLRPTEPAEQEMDPTAKLTFNLRLSGAEREAKEKLSLPFVFSKEKKTALLHSVPGSGKILYEPDANDDFDDEDPDDDLDV